MKFQLLSLALVPLSFPLVLSAQEADTLDEMVVTGKAENLLSQAATSSEGHADFLEIAQRPLARRSEILEVVPGMVTTQHAGGG